jgi:hypothetical protein
MVVTEDILHGIQCPANLQEVLAPALGVALFGHNVRPLVKAEHATGETLLRQEADPSHMFTRSMSMGFGSKPGANTTGDTTPNEHTFYFRVFQFIRPL